MDTTNNKWLYGAWPEKKLSKNSFMYNSNLQINLQFNYIYSIWDKKNEWVILLEKIEIFDRLYLILDIASLLEK